MWVTSGMPYLLTALLVFSSAGSAFTLLNSANPALFMPCNVLCSSNMTGAVLLSLFFRKDLSNVELYKAIPPSRWLWMVAGSILYSVVGPFLFLTGLASTDVPTAAILQRLESLNFLVLSYFALNTVVSQWTLVSSSLTLLGIVLAVISPLFFGGELEISVGYLFIIGSGYAFSASLLISKKYLSDIPVSLLAVFRVVLGSILYHILVIAINSNLGSLYSIELWVGMLPYGVVYVFLAQICWLQALQHSPPQHVSAGTTMLFVLSLMWSALLLGVFPTPAQWIGSVLLTASIVSSVGETYVTHNWRRSTETVSYNLLPIGAANLTTVFNEDDNNTPHKRSPRGLDEERERLITAGEFDEYSAQGGGLKGF